MGRVKTQIDISVRNFNITLFSRFLSLLLALGTQVALARLLGPEGRGAYATCLIFSTTLSLIFVLAFDFEAIYFVSSGQMSLSEGIFYSSIVAGAGSILAAIVGFSMLCHSTLFVAKAPSEAFLLSLCTLSTTIIALGLINLLTSVKEYNLLALMLTAYGITGFILMIVFVWAIDWGVSGAVLANLIRDMITIFVMLLYYRRRHGLGQFSFSFHKFKMLLQYAFKYYFGRLSNAMNFQIGVLILAIFAPNREVAIFAIASQIVIQLVIIPDSLVAVLTPRLSHNRFGQEKLVARISRLTGLITGLLLFVLVIFAKPIIIILFSVEFIDVASLIQILAPGIILRCMSKVLIPYLLGSGNPQKVSIASLVGTIFNFCLLVFLYPVFHLKAAAIAMSLGYAVSSCILAVSFLGMASMSIISLLKPNMEDIHILHRMYRPFLARFAGGA